MDKRYVEVYFNNEMRDLKLDPEQVYSVEIEDGFIKIFDKSENYLHCYNINNVSHYHIPDEVFEHTL